jgi:hypothetical protein
MPTFKLAHGILPLATQIYVVNASPFEQFYPEYEAEFTTIIASNCSSVFHRYLNAPGSAFQNYAACHLVVDCVLSNTPESIKQNLASAEVVLGLLPTILAQLGSTTPELSLLSSRRPLLAFLLSIGAPAVSPVRTFEYHDPVAALHPDPRPKPIQYTKLQFLLVVLLEYLAVGAAVANVWSLSWQLGQKTIVGISCGFTWLQIFWVALAAVIHLCGTLAFATRSNTIYNGDKAKGASFFRSMQAWIKRWPRNEFSPCATHTTHILSWRKENYWFLLISWIVSVGTVAHIIWGTALLSSLTFIG